MDTHNIPLAERMRPTHIENYVGQEHILAPNAVLYNAIHSQVLPSMILWGPPGTGKTTLAKIISTHTDRVFYELSAINAGVKEVREVIKQSSMQRGLFSPKSRPILFIDEIHRFSKSQQDALLGAVEKGIITLIGATTENPSFEVVSALLSRCQVYTLNALSKEQLIDLLDRAIKTDEILSKKEIDLQQTEALLRISGGDARKLYNAFELVINAAKEMPIQITNKLVEQIIQQNISVYDKNGEQHYDIVSAFIKSIRGSDPNGAVYWLARMIEGGEDVKFIARRLIISAAEDIGLANPSALGIANNCFQAVSAVGWPESRIILSQCTIYLATSPKSNSAYMAINHAQQLVKQTGDLSVPLHLRNAPTKLMKTLDYGANYKYAHDFPGNFIQQEYLPDEVMGTSLYQPSDNTKENQIRSRMTIWWNDKYS